MAYFFKWLGKNATATNGGVGVWHKPYGNRPGKWMPRIDDIIPCERGYHVCRRQDLSRWIGEELWLVEARGETIEAEDKVVVQQARLVRRIECWDEQTQRVFACLCAYSVLDLYERKYTDDLRPRNCVDVAWRFAFGEATVEELDAARYAARVAAWDAWDAARYAARGAARYAARAAAWDAARAAAWDGARYAAWDAARAAWDAARDAARAAQSELLVDLLGLDAIEGVV